MRVVALDLGERRIGVAVSDTAGLLAVPHGNIERSGDPEADRRAVGRIVDELEAERVVIGYPLSLDGNRGPAAQAVEVESAALRDVLDVPVELVDERFTTVTASRSLAAAGMRGQARRKRVDQVAATVLLQSWLDGHRERAPSESRMEPT